jgi:hypothetical protein
MARKSRGISDKRVNTLLKRISRIRSNYKTNLKYLKGEYAPMFKKSVHFERTDLGQDEDIFDIRYEMIMSNPSRIKTNKSIRKKAESFIRDYKALGMYKVKTTERRLNNYMRDEWIDNFKDLGVDKQLLNKLEEYDLWDDNRFWSSFFKSKYYIPLYKRYHRKDLPYVREAGHVKKGGSLWGNYLGEYLDEWLKKHEE